MEEFEQYSNELRMSRWQKLRMTHNDLKQEEPWVRLTYYSVAALGALSVLAFAATVVHGIVRDPTHRERMIAEQESFDSCLYEALDPSQRVEIKLDYAFPEYQLDFEIQALVDQCREEHPMPQPNN